MHILEIPSFFIPYGGEFCIEQSRALTMIGHEVRIMANVYLSVKRSRREFLCKQKGTRTMCIDGITVMRKEMRGVPEFTHLNIRRWVNGVCRMFENYVKTYGKPDIIHAHCGKWAGYAAMLIARKHDIPYVITEHLSTGILNNDFKNNKATWQVGLIKEAYYNADMVIPVSEELVDDIAFFYGKGYKWTSISNTIDTEFFLYKKRETLKNKPFRFCCLANFEPRKGYDVLLAAFGMYCGKHPDAELYIAGRYTDSSELAKMAGKYECSDNIKILGMLSKTKVRELLYKCNCLILPTRSEAQGLVLLEAMSTGIPVITTDAVPKNAYVDGGSFICHVDDTPAFCQAMCRISENYEAIDGKKLSEKVEKMASMKAVGEKLDKLFSHIVNERHSI